MQIPLRPGGSATGTRGQTPGKWSWTAANWGVIGAIVLDLVVAMVVLALIWNQPQPTIKVTVVNEFYIDLGIDVYIDDELVGSADIEVGETITIVEWTVSEGSHTITVDRSGWDSVDTLWNGDEIAYTNHFSKASEYEITVTFGQGTSSIAWRS